MKNGQKELFFKREIRRNVSPKAIIEFYFKETSDKGICYHTKVNSELEHLFDCTIVAPLGKFDHPIFMGYDYNTSRFVKMTLTSNCRNQISKTFHCDEFR